jgi:hypothetical protein
MPRQAGSCSSCQTLEPAKQCGRCLPSLVCSSIALRFQKRSLDWGVETLRMVHAMLRDVVFKGLALARLSVPAEAWAARPSAVSGRAA